MPSVFKKAGPTPGKGKMSTKGTFQSEQSHVQKHGSKKKKSMFGKIQTIWYILSIGYK